jgi:hypothetical protein
MSTPDPGSDPNFARENGPDGQPGWSAPQGQQGNWGPAPGYGGSAAGYGAPGDGRRPGVVTAAGVVGIVWGALGAVLFLIAMLGAFALGVAVAGLIALLALAFYIAMLVGGISVLRGRSPKLLLYVSYVAIALGLIGLIVSAVASGGSVTSGILGIVVSGVIVALLLQQPSKQYYAARGLSY